MKVLIAVDGSDNSYNALEWYLEFTFKPKDHIIFIQIASPFVATVPTFMVGGATAVTPDAVKSYYHSLDVLKKDVQSKIAELLEKHKVKDCSYEHLHQEGDAGHVLCKIAQDKKVDMIIMGSRGLGTVRRTILGSVSDYVVHHAHCPVSVCK